MDRGQLLLRYLLGNTKKLDTDDLAGLIEIEYHPRTDFLGFHYIALDKAEIKGVVLLVHPDSHLVLLSYPLLCSLLDSSGADVSADAGRMERAGGMTRWLALLITGSMLATSMF